MREALGLTLIFLAAFLAISLYTYSPLDPGPNQASSHAVRNMVGLAGAYSAGLLVDFFGVGAWLAPLGCLYVGLGRFVRRLGLAWWRWIGLVLFCLCLFFWAAHPWTAPLFDWGDIHGGGFAGDRLLALSTRYLRLPGAFLLWLLFTLVAVQFGLGVSLGAFVKRLKSLGYDFTCKHWERLVRKYRTARALRAERAETRRGEKARKAEAVDQEADESLELPRSLRSEPDADPAPANPKPKAKAKPAPAGAKGRGGLPGLDLLAEPPASRGGTDPARLKEMAASLTSCLADFGVQGEIASTIPGPVVTMFEFRPAPGVKISRIAGLADDISLALKATAVRIEAPIPGKDTVGVEIPNESRQTVYLREILDSDAFTASSALTTMALGKDIQGRPKCADLAKMPHLLVAGATGAGKSVCLNTILMSFLYKASPDELKLLLIDPKRIELSVYAQLPHLVHPVVTDMNLAKSALDWAVHEMDQRYERMAQMGVRNIEGYNKKVAELPGKAEEGEEPPEPMPYLVIVVDELADLMMTQGKEVEMAIVRLAQLARAAGIHIILATQRPSVDVVTGLIKANFPTRISFQVTSKHDSRTILDTVGAEKLLGRGDMLFKPGGSKLMRLHGAFVDESEIAKVLDHLAASASREFDLDFSSWGQEANGPEGSGGAGLSGDDPMYDEAVQFVCEQGKASISLIQRRFRIGFNRAARYIEQMERDGLLGPQEGAKPRAVVGKPS